MRRIVAKLLQHRHPIAQAGEAGVLRTRVRMLLQADRLRRAQAQGSATPAPAARSDGL